VDRRCAYELAEGGRWIDGLTIANGPAFAADGAFV
jgi:hypothetical protein